eukprot:COSAG02_NODE_3582_length_6531_cov_4.696206_6_plen_385_part_00
MDAIVDAIPEAGAGALELVRSEAVKAQIFAAGRTLELRSKIDALRQKFVEGDQRTGSVFAGASSSDELRRNLSAVELEMSADEVELLKKCGWRLWHTVELLENFVSLNHEAIARLVRCVDSCSTAEAQGPGAQFLKEEAAIGKLVDGASELVPYKNQLTELLAEKCYDGDVSAAEMYLRSAHRREAGRSTIFLAGFTSGFCVCFAAGIIALAPDRVIWSQHFMFYTYRSAGLVALSLWLWAVNILIFERFGINHVFILQTSPAEQCYLHPSQLVEVAAIWTVLLLSAFWIQASNTIIEKDIAFTTPPVVVWCIVLVLFCMPCGTQSARFLHSSRAMLKRTIARVLTAPFHPVIFRDVLLGDILTVRAVSYTITAAIFYGHHHCY